MITIISILSVILTLCYIAVVLFFIIGWKSIPVFVSKNTEPKTKASILIAARNEEKNIERTINALLAQSYPSALTEIIIVDDHSSDRTAELVRSYADKGVQLLQLKEDRALNSYKKKAISVAIDHATGTLMVTTDADCVMGTEWLSEMISFYESGDYKFISAPVAYFEEKSNFELMQSLEFLYLIGLGASTIGNKKPSTCNGANLAYQRDAFFEVGGFKGIDDLASGDDELLLHKVASKYPTQIGFLRSSKAIVYTHAKATIAEFIQQRRRWASKSTKYKNKGMVVLGASIWLFNLIVLLNLVLGVFIPAYLCIFLGQFLLKVLIEFVFLRSMTLFAKRPALIWWLPVLNVFHTVYMVYIGIMGNAGKYNWKDRMVN